MAHARRGRSAPPSLLERLERVGGGVGLAAAALSAARRCRRAAGGALGGRSGEAARLRAGAGGGSAAGGRAAAPWPRRARRGGGGGGACAGRRRVRNRAAVLVVAGRRPDLRLALRGAALVELLLLPRRASAAPARRAAWPCPGNPSVSLLSVDPHQEAYRVVAALPEWTLQMAEFRARADGQERRLQPPDGGPEARRQARPARRDRRRRRTRPAPRRQGGDRPRPRQSGELDGAIVLVESEDEAKEALVALPRRACATPATSGSSPASGATTATSTR